MMEQFSGSSKELVAKLKLKGTLVDAETESFGSQVTMYQTITSVVYLATATATEDGEVRTL